MRAGVVVSGVLGLGTVLVFVAAAVVSAMFPNGTTVAAGWNSRVVWNGGVMEKGGGFVNGGIEVPPPPIIGDLDVEEGVPVEAPVEP